MRRRFRHLLLGLAASVAFGALAAAPPPKSVPELANLYIRDGENKLADQDRQSVVQLKSQLTAVANNPRELRKRTDALLNQLTIALAGMQSAKGLTVAAAYVVKFDPDNPRATNLFGEVLHATNRFQDAATVLEAFLVQAPGNVLAMLNLANVDLDLNRDAQAKKLLDQVLKQDADNRDAYKALAIYWYRKQNLREFHDALLKSSSFEGYVVRKAGEADQPVDQNAPEPSDSLARMEAKLAQLKTRVPLTIADVIETELPREARLIRDKYGKLLDRNRFKLPLFPQVNTNSNRDYQERFPIVAAWMQVFVEKQKDFLLKEQYQGKIDPYAGEAVVAQQSRALVQKQLNQALQSAQDTMRFVQGMPGMDAGLVRDALGQVDQAAQQHGVALQDKPVDPDNPPGWDSGALFAKANYRNYLVISRSYETYIRVYFGDYQGRVLDNAGVYVKKMTQEATQHDDMLRSIEARCNTMSNRACEVLRRKEDLRNKQSMNLIGDTYYKHWVNLYIPQYTKKMKPMLEEYWSVCALYIRNMNDPQVMEREYLRVKSYVMTYAVQAGMAAGDGGGYAYVGTTEEEEAALQAALAAAEEEAPLKQAGFLKDYQTPHERDWVDWIGDNLVFEASIEALSLKITATSIEFEAFAPLAVGPHGLVGPAGGFKVDFLDETLETYVSVASKFSLGVTVTRVEVKGEGKVEFAKRTAKWDFRNGTYAETTVPGAKGEAKAAFGPLLSGSSEFELDVQGNAKIGGKLTAGVDTGTTLQGTKLPDLSVSLKGEVSNQKN